MKNKKIKIRFRKDLRETYVLFKLYAKMRYASFRQRKNKGTFVHASREEIEEVAKLCNIKIDKCYYCKKKIKKNEKISIYNKPNRIVCNSILCTAEAITEWE